jgi:hypothetical protein
MQRRKPMRTTVTIDDKLLQDAMEYSGVKEVPALIRKALQEYVQLEAGRRLAQLGGTEPGLQYIPRRRPPRFTNDAPEAQTGKRRGRQAAE